MSSESGVEVRIVYQDGDFVRRIHGELINENEKFVTVDLDKYTVRIAVQHIFKIETVKSRGGCTNG